ncbi:MAG: CvpA family protein [Leptothrix sp. (in: b-proteobacteria)]
MTAGNWVDAAVLVGVLLSVLLGALRGLVQEVMSLLGWLVAWLAAQAWGVALARHLPTLPLGAANGAAVRQVLGFALCFVSAIVVWRLFTWLVSRVIQATPLAPLDRALGGLFGALRAGVALLVLVTLVQHTPLARTSGWIEARSVAGARWLLASVAPALARPARSSAPNQYLT